MRFGGHLFASHRCLGTDASRQRGGLNLNGKHHRLPDRFSFPDIAIRVSDSEGVWYGRDRCESRPPRLVVFHLYQGAIFSLIDFGGSALA